MAFFQLAATVIREITILSILAVILVVSLMGLPLPASFPVTNLGTRQIAAFPSGFALYTPDRLTHFYSFSPLNDFYVLENGQRVALLSTSTYTNQTYSTSLVRPHFTKLLELWSQPGAKSQYLEFEPSQAAPIFYQISSPDPQTITFQRHYQLTQPNASIAWGTTLRYHPDDVIVDETGRALTPYSVTLTDRYPRELLQQLQFSTTSVERTLSSTPTVFIFHPEQPGAIRLTTQPHQKIWIDPELTLIEVFESSEAYQQHASTSELKLNYEPTITF